MSTRTTSRRRLVAGGLIAATLTVGGTGVAAAATPGTPTEGLLDAFGLRVSHGSSGHNYGVVAPAHGQAAHHATPPARHHAPGPVQAPVSDDAAYDAFWTAGYTYDDAVALADLWQVDVLATKAKAGHLLLDGDTLPIPPGTAPSSDPTATGCAARSDSGLVEYTDAQYEAFWGAGYTESDLEELSILWNTGCIETKSQAGQLLLDGKPVPVTPGSSIAG